MANASPIPHAIVAALHHVREHHPDVVRVTYAQEDAEHGGFWRFETATGDVPRFGSGINVSLLEDALDAAWEDRPFPATYTIEETTHASLTLATKGGTNG